MEILSLILIGLAGGTLSGLLGVGGATIIRLNTPKQATPI